LTDPFAAARPHLRHNFVVHTIDAGFFGLGLGFASFVTLMPLFIATLTDLPLAIGLIAVVHPLGWHLPQLLTAGRVAKLSRYLPMVLVMTSNERLPFFALAGLALVASELEPWQALTGAYVLVLWIGLGGGLTANAFQSMVAHIVPPRRRGAFYGAKTAAANLCLAGGAIVAGRILGDAPTAARFAPCFALAGVATIISWLWLAWTKEPEDVEPEATHRHAEPPPLPILATAVSVLRRDRGFRRYLLIRTMSQVAMMSTAFYTVFAADRHGLTAATAGLMTAVFAGGQVVGNPIMGAAGDRWGHRPVMAAGMIAACGAALVAAWAPVLGRFYLVFALAGLANVAVWTLPLAMTLEFGTPADRPVYIGLANTLVAPSIALAPLLGGWLAQVAGYEALFGAAALAGLLTAGLLRGKS
jgi:MFS family permease